MSAREEFIELYSTYIKREGAAALLDYLQNRSDFLRLPRRPAITARMRAVCATTASTSTTASGIIWSANGCGSFTDWSTAKRA